MNPRVRNLYKRVLVVGREWPGGLDYVRKKAKEEFRKNAHLTEESDIKRAVARGRWYVRNEMAGMIMLAKYRAMKRRYY